MLAVTLTLSLAPTLDVHAAPLITRMSDGLPVDSTQVVSAAQRSDLVMIGEVHDDKRHHALQLAVIRSLREMKVPLE